MRRKQRQAAKHAAGRGKGRATPKRPPHGLTRAAHTATMGRRARRELEGAPGALERALAAVKGARGEEQAHLERMLREAGAVDLSRPPGFLVREKRGA